MSEAFACPLCSAGGTTIHEKAHALLHEALRVCRMQKAHRDQYLAAAKASLEEQAYRDLVSVINAVRAHARRVE